VIAAVAPDPAGNSERVEWVRRYWEDLRPHSAGGAYVNFLMDEGSERVATTYRANLARLRRIKGQYDPGNLLRRNQNILPAS
jgi:FAD/FMN-containing dehydrogenase